MIPKQKGKLLNHVMGLRLRPLVVLDFEDGSKLKTTEKTDRSVGQPTKSILNMACIDTNFTTPKNQPKSSAFDDYQSLSTASLVPSPKGITKGRRILASNGPSSVTIGKTKGNSLQPATTKNLRSVKSTTLHNVVEQPTGSRTTSNVFFPNKIPNAQSIKEKFHRSHLSQLSVNKDAVTRSSHTKQFASMVDQDLEKLYQRFQRVKRVQEQEILRLYESNRKPLVKLDAEDKEEGVQQTKPLHIGQAFTARQQQIFPNSHSKRKDVVGIVTDMRIRLSINPGTNLYMQ